MTEAKPNQHHVLVVGAGSIGERHLRCFLATGRARVSFVEVRPELRAEIAARYPAATAFPSLDDVLDLAIECAVVATPAPLHLPQATQLAERGRHLLIEKPLGVGLAGIEELRDAVDRNRVTVGVGYVYRAHPVLAEMRSVLASGRFGRPVELVAVCGQHFPFYRPAYRQTYYASRASGGGAVQDAITHVLNAGQWLVGPMNRVVADVAHQVLEGVDVEDTVHVLARHGDVLATYALNQHQAPNEVTITVVCEHGTARFESHNCRWRSMTEPGGEWADHGGPVLERDELFIRQAAAFLDAVEGKSPLLCTLDEAVHTLHINLAVLASAETGVWQPIPAEH
ncbi:MAG: Gfo/Idh/MocA family oxidoreductase [Planctomycetaceae bacterium]